MEYSRNNPTIQRLHVVVDGGYNEHGREIFDEEVADKMKTSGSRSKKVGVVLLLGEVLIFLDLQGVSKRVAKPSANLKHLLMRGGPSEKKKEVGRAVICGCGQPMWVWGWGCIAGRGKDGWSR